jgi:hypothetical protein
MNPKKIRPQKAWTTLSLPSRNPRIRDSMLSTRMPASGRQKAPCYDRLDRIAIRIGYPESRLAEKLVHGCNRLLEYRPKL